MGPTIVRKTAHDVANGIAAAIALLEAESFRDLYADEFVIWHNHDGVSQNKEENITFLRELFKNFKNLSYINVRRKLTESGYVQQHVLVGETIRGEPFAMPACHISEVREGKLVRIDEYFDPTPLYEVLA